ncbi:hypothetical protein X773_27225 [Mesorhizobium sp. LSJC285A00]|uniref:hypothetical protein n=1 Tax=Mesorhizobium sp. LSJC285A00 TaxID=1287338 RepID=UPI0003CE72AC|nr:hypothetical protein [Mesorhizobium sp. LSJC285A00]ESW73505.1 hypothetical protein X773_27225 [Mesorhizobium sp. LSJC285A00]
MEAIFDDIASALRELSQDVWRPARAFAIDAAGKLFLGLGIGLGVAICKSGSPVLASAT